MIIIHNTIIDLVTIDVAYIVLMMHKISMFFDWYKIVWDSYWQYLMECYMAVKMVYYDQQQNHMETNQLIYKID